MIPSHSGQGSDAVETCSKYKGKKGDAFFLEKPSGHQAAIRRPVGGPVISAVDFQLDLSEDLPV